MNRFATSSEPGGASRPAPAAPAAVPDAAPTGVRAWRAGVRWIRGISGLDAYDRYLRHAAAAHPDESPLSEAEFWRCRWDDDSKNPKARCC